MGTCRFLDQDGLRADLVLVSLPTEEHILGRDTKLPTEALSIARLATDAASFGLDVAICDADEQQLELDEAYALILAARCDVVAATAYATTIVDTLALLAKVKRQSPDVMTCIGGYQASPTASDILEHEPQVDAVVVGRGETILPALVHAHKKQKVSRGVYSSAHVWQLPVLPGRQPIDESQMWGWAARYWPRVYARRGASMVTSDGCLSNCSFCATPQFERLFAGRVWRPREVNDVVAEITSLVAHVGPLDVRFHDPDFLSLTPDAWDRAAQLARALVNIGFGGSIRFTAQARAVARQSKEFWEGWRSAGLECVFVGLESGNDAVLREYRKSSSVTDNLIAARSLREANIPMQAGFIMFTPQTTREELTANVEFLQLVGVSHFGRHYCSALRVYPGTRDFSRYSAEGLIELDRSYLPPDVNYSDPWVARLALELATVAQRSYPIDRFLMDLEFSASSASSSIQTQFGPIPAGDPAQRLHAWIG